jgi:hypothetical protein
MDGNENLTDLLKHQQQWGPLYAHFGAAAPFEIAFPRALQRREA